MSVNAITVKYWNEIAEERQLAHVIQTAHVVVDIHSLDQNLNDVGGKLIGRTWLKDIERAAETGKTLVISGLPDSNSTRIDGETAKNLLGAIRRKQNPSEVFAYLESTPA